jgi:hypothetical protein
LYPIPEEEDKTRIAALVEEEMDIDLGLSTWLLEYSLVITGVMQ